VKPARRAWLLALAALPMAGRSASPATTAKNATPNDDRPRRDRVLQFPRDHGAHLGARTEWWYITGWLGTESRPVGGFQVTFFRSRTGMAQGHPSRFAARQLLFAHAAVTVLGGDGNPAPVHLHDQRIERWNGDPQAPLAAAATDTARVHIGNWRLALEGERWTSRIPAADFSLELDMARTQPLLLQGDAGFSRKGPDEAVPDQYASHYVTEPQLAVRARVGVQGRNLPATQGRAWMDHEWSDELLHPEAVGWDWIGINLLDGGALTAFRLRRSDGTALWAGGSQRGASGPARSFAPADVRFEPLRRWRSPATGVSWPVEWRVDTPAGRHVVRALANAQELDSRASIGALYWEGLSELLDESGRRVGLGYLELTGYGSALRI
jgi:predicted secreted hydrolase